MSKHNLYLAGQMSGLTFDQMNSWRIEASKKLSDFFNVINPVDYYNFDMDSSTYTETEVEEFDLWAVEHSKIVLVNLEYPNSIGTAIELHDAHKFWSIPVVAYGGDLNRVHPWIKKRITKYCLTLEDAVDHIVKYYLPNLT